MRCFFSSLLAITAFLLGASGARAGLTLSVAAESADLSHLTVGQSVRFDVLLSGLNSGDQLDYLAGTVTFDSSLLGSGTNVNAGVIVPDPTGFVSAGFAGAADAFYDAVFFSATHTPISSNGVFYTFDIVAQQPGSGSLAFDLTSLAASDGTNTPVSLGAGPALPFTIEAAVSVPEPNSLVVALTALAGCGGAVISRRLKRRRRQRH
jgi:hypothetical protein